MNTVHRAYKYRFDPTPEQAEQHDRDINAANNILKAGKAILAGADKLREHQRTTTPDVKPAEFV